MTGINTRIDARAGWGLAAVLALVAQFAPASAIARPAAIAPSADASDDSDALPYVECVPYARQASGIQLFGDAHTWWDQADGQYARGHVPVPGAVMSFRPHGGMRLGHVAMVSKVIDTRTVLLRHSNWSPIDGRRGQAEVDVRAVDVSEANDWSEVRVWYAPIGDLGTTRWPVNGFIYKHPLRDSEPPLLSAKTVLAQADTPRVTRLSAKQAPASAIDGDFLDGIRAETGAVPPHTTRATAHRHPARTYLFASATAPSAPATITPALRDDPIGRIIAARMGRSRD
jgi:surface antigen